MLWPNALTEALADVLGRLLGFIPGFLSVLAILIVGWVIALVLRKAIVTVVSRVGLDSVLDKAGITRIVKDSGSALPPSEILGRIVYWIVMVAVFIAVTNYLQLTAVSSALNSLLRYVPNVLAAIIIIVIAFILGNSLAAIVKGAATRAEISRADMLADVAKWAVVTLALIIALDQLQIQTDILKLALTYFVGAAAAGVALAFGLGGTPVTRNVSAVFFIRERFQVGNRITVEQYSGEIKKIGLIFTTIGTADKGIVDIPNSVLMEKVVTS